MATAVSSVVPSLLAIDMGATLAFYRKLHFRVTGHDHHSEPTWAEVCRDTVTFQFYSDPPHGTPAAPALSGTLYLSSSNVDELAAEVRAAGLPLEWGPEVMPYGMREFAVKDPNGYLIAFTEPATRAGQRTAQ